MEQHIYELTNEIPITSCQEPKLDLEHIMNCKIHQNLWNAFTSCLDYVNVIHVIHPSAHPSTVPHVLRICSEFIEEHGVVDGIYRLSGVSSNIQKLRCVGGPNVWFISSVMDARGVQCMSTCVWCMMWMSVRVFSRSEFDNDASPDLHKDVYLQDIHCVSSLCKAYFRELPNPLLTYNLYDKFAVSDV